MVPMRAEKIARKHLRGNGYLRACTTHKRQRTTLRYPYNADLQVQYGKINPPPTGDAVDEAAVVPVA